MWSVSCLNIYWGHSIGTISETRSWKPNLYSDGNHWGLSLCSWDFPPPSAMAQPDLVTSVGSVVSYFFASFVPSHWVFTPFGLSLGRFLPVTYSVNNVIWVYPNYPDLLLQLFGSPTDHKPQGCCRLACPAFCFVPFGHPQCLDQADVHSDNPIPYDFRTDSRALDWQQHQIRRFIPKR